jgi:cell division protein ZapE
MTPWKRYQADLQREEISADPAQRNAVEHTQALYKELLADYNHEDGLITIIRQTLGSQTRQVVKGLYFWGGVGRGKTWIVDTFYDCLPFAEKKRIHFHRFMQMIHNELKQLQNKENPLFLIADKIVTDTRVLCFDEFHVTDITDAMLLGGLLKELFERGLVLVATSNEEPDQLYRDGLQRDRFLPAIELIKTHTRVVNIDSGIDYRLRFLDKAEIYHCPLDENADRMLHKNFIHIAPDEGSENVVLEIDSRPINTVRCGDGVAWFDFLEICDGPRGPADYIEIARLYQTVMIANLPVLEEADNDRVKRFMTLVDEFYDRNVKLIMTAAAEPEHLYLGKRLARPFQRTISRLNEMRTHDYLAKQHLS